MTRSRDVADTQDNLGGAVAPVVSGKNFIINGGYDIFQRSTFNSQTGSAYALDRWYSGVGGTVTITQQTTGAPAGSQYCMRIAYNAASSFANQFQALESANASLLAGQTVTATVLVRANATWAATASQGLNFFVEKNSTANTLTGGSWTSIASTTVTGAAIATGTGSTNWTKLTITCAIPNDGTAAGVRLRIGESVVGPSGAYWEMAQAQLEIGSVATPFSRAGGTIGGELALCQRYYQRFSNLTAFERLAFGAAVSTSSVQVTVPLRTTMRVATTSIDFAGITVYDGVTQSGFASSVVLDSASANFPELTIAGGIGVTATYRPYWAIAGNTINGSYLGFSAEL
jgi:hypothetical protein